MLMYDLGNQVFKHESDIDGIIDFLILCVGYCFDTKNG